jgi:glycosyltransferase involved in cell wall biosynthesis
MSRSILLVAYFYPPSRDTGALRPASMARWLRKLGHDVTVLTTSAYGSLPDDEEQGIVRTADAQLWRARLHGRKRIEALYDSDSYGGKPHPLSRLIVPEPLALAWIPFARSRALRLAARREFDCVITSSPPESAHAIGLALRRRHHITWVADIRDAWNFEPLRPRFPTGAQRRLDHHLERRWLRGADAVVAVSKPAADDLRIRLGIDAHLVRNGWDPEAVGGADAAPGSGVSLDPERVSLVYAGRFGSYGRDPEPLVEGLRELARRNPDAGARLELVIAGPLTEAERELFAADVSPARIVLAGSLERDRAFALQREADCLLLLAQPARSQLLNIKLFEYLATGRPILALAAGTEAGRVGAELGADPVAADDPDAIADALARLVREGVAAPDPAAVARFTYPGPAEEIAEVVELAIAARPPTPA